VFFLAPLIIAGFAYLALELAARRRHAHTCARSGAR
jgi:hypothetical protein